MKNLVRLLALVALIPRAEAATATLSGAGGATLPGLSWATAGNWSPPAVPGSNDNAVVAATGWVDIRGSAFAGASEIQDLAFTGTAAVTLHNNSSSTPMVLSLNGGRGPGVPLISATGNVARTITGPGTNPTPQPLGLQLKASGVIDVATNTLTISCIISESGGARSLTKNGAGTLVLVGRNSYSGGTVVNAGVLELTNANSGNGRIKGAITVNSGAELRLTGGDGTGLGYNSGNKADSLAINGGIVSSVGAMHIWNMSGGVNLTSGELRSNGGVSSPTGSALEWGDTVVNTFASSTTSVIAGRINLRADSGSANSSLLTFNVADGPAETDLLVSAALTQSGRPIGSTTGGSCGLVKKGAGTLRLTGSVQLTGLISVEAGTLDLATSSLTTNARINVAEGAQLKLPAGTNMVRNVFFEDVKLPAGRWGAPGSVAAGLADYESAAITGPGVLRVADTGPSARERWKRMKYGQFTHYVYFGVNPDGSSFSDAEYSANNFNAPKFANDLASMGVEYVIFTAWHANFVPMFNSAAVVRALGFQRNSSRDVVGDMLAAVRAKGIRVILYAHPNQPVIYNFTGHNDMLNDCYGEMLDRYGDQIDGFWLDENDPGGNQDGSVDFPRLERTIRRRNPDVVLIQNNYGNLYSADVGTSEWGPPSSADFSANIGQASVMSAARPMAPGWNTTQSTNSYAARYSAEGIFRATVVAAASCIEGGGIGWAAGPYPGGGWEQGVLETMQGAGALMAPVAVSITNTYPSTSWPLSSGFMGNVDINGAVATRSIDDAKEYVHVLYPPAGNTLTLPTPADGKVFGAARLLANGAPVTFSQTATGVQFTLTGTNTWSTTDTVIELEVICRGGLGIVNNTSAAIRYDGRSWAHLPNRGLGEFQNDVHAATADGDSFTFYFDGTDVELIGSRGADRGLVDFYVDGMFQATVNMALSPTNRTTLFAVSGLARGPHTLRGVKRGGAALVVDAFKATEWIDSEDPDVTYQALTLFNNTDTTSNAVGYIEYDGNWQWQQRDRNEYYRDAHWAAANGSTFHIRFNGTGVKFVGTKDGLIDFYLDGAFVRRVNMGNFGSLDRNIGIDIKGLPAGNHTLTGVKVGDTYCLVDAFFVYNEQNSSWSTQADGNAAGGSWRRSSAFGDVATVKFNGVGIDVIAPHSRSGGTVAVDVEGVSGRLVNQYSGTTQHQSLSYSSLEMMPLSPGDHLLGMSHNRSFGSIAVDGFRIHKDAAPVASAPLVPAGSVWKFNDTGANLGTAWRSNTFNDAAWPSGPAMLGYGDVNGTTPRTTNNFGPDPNNKYITTYYRHAFTVANPTAFVGLDLRVQRDDGAIVYLNGVEIFRSNIPTGVVNSLTLASASVAGADETTFVSIEVSPWLLRAGTNLIAAEIHQATADSSDLAFDLELIPTKAFEADFLPAGSSWRYNDTGANLGTSWRDTNFNDSAWPVGKAQLGFGDGDETTVIASNRQVTTYFRRWVNIPNPADYAFTVSLLRDDGAVVYLNGVEVFRSNMPTGGINYLTLAASSALPAEETTFFYSAALNASQFVPGWNLLAVEVHQSSTNSSDLSVDLKLAATPSPQLPTLGVLSVGTALILTWPDSAGAFALHTTTNLAPPVTWTPGTSEPVLLGNKRSVTLPVATNGQRFFRLQTP